MTGGRRQNSRHTQAHRQLQITKQMTSQSTTKPAWSIAARSGSQRNATAARLISAKAFSLATRRAITAASARISATGSTGATRSGVHTISQTRR